MGLDAKNGCRLSCIALLSASCLSFQNNLHRIPLPSPGLQWRFPESASPKLERPSAKQIRRSYRNIHPYEPSPTSNFAFGMTSELSSDSDTDHEDINMNGNVNGNDNFVQNRTNNIKIEEEDSNPNHIEQKLIRYSLDISKHYFDEMETRSGKDYRWIKPLTKPVSHAMRNDIKRRKDCYVSDWTDGFKNMKKVIPAVMFLYFACLSPAISFGTIASQITDRKSVV